MSITNLKKRSGAKLSPRKETVSKNMTEIGPLASTFPCSESKILDHMVTMKDFDYSISDISKISGIGFKTTLNIVHKLEDQGILKRTRKIGNAILFKLNPDSAQAKSIGKLAFEIAKKRIRKKL
ncbi:MAG TPA: hypothetical protein VFW99_01150 [Candidatus Nitrosotalea sp.]|nr:hypothetical protein [Candidatus Nitrosotalea sp.]